MSKPILTRKSYREQLEKQQRELAEQEEFLEEGETYVSREKKPLRERYNRFLNIWLIVMGILLAIVIAVQIFL